MSTDFFDRDEVARLRAPHASRTVDLSLVSRVLEPFWDRVADLVPAWIAPNAITLAGFGLVALSFVAMAAANPSFRGPVPPALHVGAILAIFAFQTLDAVDGKQARKTKSSSALGNWFDHASDVAAVQLAMATAGAAIGLGAGGAMLFLLGSVIVNNYVIHWETRHTGTLYMGNGTSIYEAQLTMMAVHALTLVVGVEPWGRAVADLVPFASALPFASAPLRLWVVVGGVGAIGGVGIAGSIVRVARTGATRAVFAELALPVALCAAGARAVMAVEATLPLVFAVSLLGLYLIARQILGHLVASTIRIFDWRLLPLAVSALALPSVESAAVASAIGWANLGFALCVTGVTYLGATRAIARALGIPILTLPRR